jgi:HK97 family phage prohead protease
VSTDTEDFELKHLYAPFEVKDISEDARTFEGLAAVWDLDLGDDVIHRSAFKDTLAAWRKSSTAMPLLNSHNHFDIMSGLGQMIDAKEMKDGLWSKWEVIDGPDGDRVLERVRPSKRTGRAVVGSMSIGFMPQKVDFEESDAARSGEIRNIRKIDLKEVSLVLFPMAPGALVDMASVKALFAGRTFAPDLDAALKSATAPAPSEPSIVDAPDPTPLDRLRVQRMRLRARRS